VAWQSSPAAVGGVRSASYTSVSQKAPGARGGGRSKPLRPMVMTYRATPVAFSLVKGGIGIESKQSWMNRNAVIDLLYG
jgi:hypothetical protein